MNPLTGRFWTADDYEGSGGDPNSLHKYMYASGDGVNASDPSGNFSLSEISISSAINVSFRAVRTVAVLGAKGGLIGGLVGGGVGGYFHVLKHGTFEGLAQAMWSGAVQGAAAGMIIGVSTIHPVALAITLGAFLGINIADAINVISDPDTTIEVKVAVIVLLAVQAKYSASAVASKGPKMTVANSTKGWRVGDPINNLTAKGNVPSWDTVRARYWKNEALNNSGKYSAENLALMRKGGAPQRVNPTTKEMESKELHHDPPQRDGGLFDVEQVWPDEHAAQDPFRNVGEYD